MLDLRPMAVITGSVSNKGDEADRQPANPPHPLLLVRRVLALGLLAAALCAGHTFPVAPGWLVGGLAAYALLLAWAPSAWLVVVPALIPVLDLTPWSGRLYVNELDFFLLVTVASALWHPQPWFRTLRLSRPPVLVLALVVVWQTLTTLRGLLPIQPLDANALAGYYSHWNSLRLARGFLWAVLLLPLLGQARARGDAAERWLSAGMLVGLAAAVLTVLWERAVFTGLLDFDQEYRVTGMFSGMHTGGAPVDAYLVTTIAFTASAFLLWRRVPVRAAGLVLFAGGIYALLVTFTRTNYLALAAMATTLVAGALLLARASGSPARRWAWSAGLASLLALALAVPVLGGAFIQSRLADALPDLKGRLAHWSRLVQQITSDPAARALGMGKGAYPRTFVWIATDQDRPSTYGLVTEGENTVLRFGKSGAGNLVLRQRFTVTEPGPYRLTVNLRPVSAAPTSFLVEICERNILSPYRECFWTSFRTAGDPGIWEQFEWSFDVSHLGGDSWLGARPVEVALLHRGLAVGVDIDAVRVLTPAGRDLIVNGDFSSGLDRWHLWSGEHRLWHALNLWVDAFFEGGWLGLAALLILQVFWVVRLATRVSHGDPMALVLAIAFAGLLAVGLFDSSFDDPRISLLFFLLTWFVMLPTQRPPVHEPPTGAPARVDTRTGLSAQPASTQPHRRQLAGLLLLPVLALGPLPFPLEALAAPAPETAAHPAPARAGFVAANVTTASPPQGERGTRPIRHARTFAELCEEPGVLACFDFDGERPLASRVGTLTASLGATRDRPAKAYLYRGPETRGGGAVRMDFLPSDGPDHGGLTFTLNEFREGDTIVVQWRQWFSPELVTTFDSERRPIKSAVGGDGAKQLIINEIGDPAGCSFGQIVANTSWNGPVGLYHGCGLWATPNVPDPTGTDPYDYDIQPGGDNACRYRYVSHDRNLPNVAYLFPTDPPDLLTVPGFHKPVVPGRYHGCIGWKPAQWMTFRLEVTLVFCPEPWTGRIPPACQNLTHGDSAARIRYWVKYQEDPRPWLVYDFPMPMRWREGHSGRYGRFGFTPYNTNETPSNNKPSAFVLYDDIFVAKNPRTPPWPID